MRLKENAHHLLDNHAESGMIHERGVWYATVEGERVRVPSELGQNINTALRFQLKVEKALFSSRYSPFLKIASLLNCRKTIETVVGKRTFGDLKKEMPEHESMTAENTDSLSGVDELMTDVDQILSEGGAPILGTSEEMSLGKYFDEHRESTPSVIHIFNIKRKFMGHFVSKLMTGQRIATEDVRTQLNRDHTLLVLGRTASGRYICFQKRGPNVFQPFELTYLENTLETSVHPAPGKMYVTFARPVSAYSN